jgi:hypothetical protein
LAKAPVKNRPGNTSAFIYDPNTMVCRLSRKAWTGIIAQEGTEYYFLGKTKFGVEQIRDEGDIRFYSNDAYIRC